MAKDKENTSAVQQDEFTEEQINYVYADRRYVGTKETVGFVLWDAAQSFNINTYEERFITSVVKVDLGLQTLAKTINSVWDIVNDVFMGAIVDKTRTRWGKFRPYLLALAIPGCVLTVLYWIMPLLFGGTANDNMLKFVFYLSLTIIREGVGTFQGISRTGLLSTITPHPVDRTRLLTIAAFASGQFGEKLPQQITTVLLDIVSRKAATSATPLGTMYLIIFVGMGVFTTLTSSGASLWFFSKSKERVLQSIKKPSITASFKSIINNKPVLLITLSDFLSGFSIGGSKQDYYIDVLNFASMTLVAGIPAAPLSPISYTFVPWFRRKFSTRFLYIMSHYISNFLYIPIFLFGCIGMNTKTFKGGLYRKIVPMGIAMALWEVIWTLFYGLSQVIGTEVYNECMDYCEWKNGYRTEAMTSVAKGLARKVSASASSVVTTALKKVIKYDENAYMAGGQQSDKVKFFLFAMFTIIPSLTGLLGIVPMLFYDLSGKKRERMYAELLTRRAEMSETATQGDSESIERLAQAQLEIGEKNKEKNL